MIQVAQRRFREFNKIEEDADVAFCNAIYVELEMQEKGWVMERLKYDNGEGIYVELPEKQELIIIVYRGEISLHLNLKFDCQKLVNAYGLKRYPGDEFEYQGVTFVKDCDAIIYQINLIMDYV
jgi:hypothetical protein